MDDKAKDILNDNRNDNKNDNRNVDINSGTDSEPKPNDDTNIPDIYKINFTKEELMEIVESCNKSAFSPTVIVLSVLLIIVTAVLAFFVYSNYDYLVFKTILTRGYVYEDSLQDLIDEELEQTDSDISVYFDDAVIDIFMDRLHEVNGDKYTHLYLPAQYTAKIENEKEIGNSCSWFPFTEDTAYLSITNFTAESASFVEENAGEIAEYDRLILDLRSNPGGYVAAANKIAELFLDEGDVISVESSKFPFLSETNTAEGDPVFDFDKIIILQDGNTASSSEILIGALRDNLDNVVLLGETTFGKGIGQYTVPLKNGFYFIATMFTWETPSGDTIHQKGIPADREFTIETLGDELGLELTISENTEE